MASGAGGPELMAHRVDRFKGARQVQGCSTGVLTCFRDDIELRGATPRSSHVMSGGEKVVAGASTALERRLYCSRMFPKGLPRASLEPELGSIWCAFRGSSLLFGVVPGLLEALDKLKEDSRRSRREFRWHARRI